jgi:16S rRNA (adenine1518-N6/adenine1519-N6)-dimethyltransferase
MDTPTPHIPKRSLGQNFLTSEAAIFKMMEAGAVGAGDTILEIGPGKGALTKDMLSRGASVVAIEMDPALVAVLQETFATEIADGRLHIVQGDALEVTDDELAGLVPEGYKVVANIPYYVTGAIIERFLSAKQQPSSMVLLMQKEVAERIVVRDGKQSILSMAVAAYCTPRYVSTVKAGSFFPIPRIDSAIVAFENINRAFFAEADGRQAIDEARFFEVMKAAFAHKRKLMAGNLAEKGIGNRTTIEAALAAVGIDPKARAEDLSAEEIRSIVTELS